MTRPPRVAIIFYETYLGCAPSVINAARSLQTAGYQVDVYCRPAADGYVAAPRFGPGVEVLRIAGDQNSIDQNGPPAGALAPSVHPPGGASTLAMAIGRRFPPSWRRTALSTAQKLSSQFKRWRGDDRRQFEDFHRGCQAAIVDRPPSAIIGVDTMGLIVADAVRPTPQTPLFYWSLELNFLSDHRYDWPKHCKRREAQSHRRSSLLIIQDPERRDALVTENQADEVAVALVPNSPAGPTVRSPRTFLHRRLGLDPKVKIVLHAGGIGPAMSSEQLAAVAAGWPADYRLVFHCHSAMSPHSRDSRRLLALGGGRVMLSTDPVDYDQIDDLFGSAHLALVAYDPTLGPNFRLMAGASGKVAHALKCGVPIICLNNPAIGRVLRQYVCGVEVAQPAGVTSAMASIDKNYQSYRDAAFECFDVAFDFDRHIKPVLAVLGRSCDQPLVTVAMPSLNQAAFIEEAIDSIVALGPGAQTIVVDGGSGDGTRAILDRHAARLDRVIIEPDGGQADAISKALAIARGHWFGWINSDDVCDASLFEQLGQTDTNRHDLLAMDVKVIGDGDDYVISQNNLSARTILRGDDYAFAQPGLWFRTDLLRRIGGLQTDLHHGFDWDLLVRYLARFPRVRYVSRIGATFRVHPQSKTSLENAKSDSENRFKVEHHIIRTRLERTLTPALIRDSRLGRRRGPWHDHLIEQLDRRDRSPAAQACGLLAQSLADPRARFSRRFIGSLIRLMSRYVRPRFWRPFLRPAGSTETPPPPRDRAA